MNFECANGALLGGCLGDKGSASHTEGPKSPPAISWHGRKDLRGGAPSRGCVTEPKLNFAFLPHSPCSVNITGGRSSPFLQTGATE